MKSDYKAPPISRESLANAAITVRNAFGITDSSKFPIVEFMELILPKTLPRFSFEIRSAEEMEGKYGMTILAEQKIVLSEEIYDRACKEDGFARFTIAHEIAHLLLHTPQNICLYSLQEGKKLEAFENPEWQANTFAAELLAPHKFIDGLNEDDVSKKYGITKAAARVQISVARKHPKGGQSWDHEAHF